MARYVTTPIFYVNAAPHLGHAYTVIAADIFARHWRQRGEEVFFLTGTDEHGEPVALAAEKQGVPPQELADRNAARFTELIPRVGAREDFFIRTSDPRHGQRVQQIVEQIKANGYVYEGTYEGWYCPRCADFKTESEIVDGNRCPIHKIELTREHEQNWFFKLSAFEDRLKALFDERTDWVMPQRFQNEARAFIDRGLHDVSLTRAKISWGVPVPFAPGQVVYVWWDALLNYLSALAFADDAKGDQTQLFWPADFQVIGKDILKFHAIYWPALLMAAGYEVPDHILVHGFLLMKDSDGTEHKMSKSLGNVLDPFEIIDRFGADALRFYLLREVSFGQDGGVSVDGFVARYESELANDFGNLASRSISMVHRYRGGVVAAGPRDPEIAAALDPLADQVAELLDAGQPSQALEVIWTGVRRLNQYVEATAPWKLAKDEAAAEQLDNVLTTLIDGVRVLAILLAPYLPETTDTLLRALSPEDTASTDYTAAQLTSPQAPFGHAIATLEPLFPKER